MIFTIHTLKFTHSKLFEKQVEVVNNQAKIINICYK